MNQILHSPATAGTARPDRPAMPAARPAPAVHRNERSRSTRRSPAPFGQRTGGARPHLAAAPPRPGWRCQSGGCVPTWRRRLSGRRRGAGPRRADGRTDDGPETRLHLYHGERRGGAGRRPAEAVGAASVLMEALAGKEPEAERAAGRGGPDRGPVSGRACRQMGGCAPSERS